MEAGDPVGDDQLVAALRKCLARVSTTVRTAVLLRFQRELSYPEMETILQVSAKTLQVRVSRALPELQRCLLKQGISL